jgi:hypothetical protein
VFGACCTPNKAVNFEVLPVGTMSQTDVKDAVRERYSEAARRVSEERSCCGGNAARRFAVSDIVMRG